MKDVVPQVLKAPEQHGEPVRREPCCVGNRTYCYMIISEPQTGYSTVRRLSEKGCCKAGASNNGAGTVCFAVRGYDRSGPRRVCHSTLASLRRGNCGRHVYLDSKS